MKELALTIGSSASPQFKVQTPEQIGTFSLNTLLTTGITILLIFAILLSLFFLIYGGISFITSAGDKQKVVAARQKLTYAIVGLIIVLASFFIVNFVYEIFGLQFTRIPFIGGGSIVNLK